MSSRACIKLFNLMDQPFYNKVEAAVLCHTTVSGDVVLGDGVNTITVVKPTSIRKEEPV
jgi:hypothetical protein